MSHAATVPALRWPGDDQNRHRDNKNGLALAG